MKSGTGQVSGYQNTSGFSDPWGTGSGSPNYAPPTVQEKAPPKKPDTGLTPGGFNIDLSDPQRFGQSVEKSGQEGVDFLTGLKNALIGTAKPDIAGHHGGLIGDVPVVADYARFQGEVIANVGNFAIDRVKDLGSALEGVAVGGDVQAQALRQAYNMQGVIAPDIKAEYDKLIEETPDKALHYMSEAYRATRKANTDNPTWWQGTLDVPVATAADVVTGVLEGFGLFVKPVERVIASMGKSTTGDVSRAQEVFEVGSGQKEHFAWGGHIGMTTVEATAYSMMAAGQWTEDQANDFLVANSTGFSHDPVTQIAATVALDPTVVPAFGAAEFVKLGKIGAALAASTERAKMGLALAEAGGDATEIAAAQKAVVAAGKLTAKQAGRSSAPNLLGRAAESQKGTQFIRLVTTPYTASQGRFLGHAGKAARFVIDPLAYIDLRGPSKMAEVDVMSTLTTHATIGAYGPIAHAGLTRIMDRLTPDLNLSRMFAEDFGRYSGNVARRVIANAYRNSALMQGAGERLKQALVSDTIGGITKMPKTYIDAVFEEAQRFRIRNWDEGARMNLATRLAAFYHVQDEAGWLQTMSKMGADQLSMLHAATYGRAVKLLLEHAGRERALGGFLSDKMDRIVLLNKQTLTKQGADGIAKRLREAASDDVLDMLRTEQVNYPALKGVSLDPNNASKSMEDMLEYLKRRYESLPQQIVDDEVAKMSPEMQDFHATIRDSFTLGFSPEDEFKWGMARDSDGVLRATGDVWADHVDEVVPMRRSAHELAYNVAGIPVLGTAAKKAGRALDYMEASGRVMTRRVTGTIVRDAARSRFVAGGEGKWGMTRQEATAIIDKLEEAAHTGDLVINPRGMTEQSMWRNAKGLVPARLQAEFTHRDLLELVLDAYEGDLRFVGLTQKFTGRVKKMLGPHSGNMLAVMAENIYPTVKFRINMVFQLQERIEPIVLNAQRGVISATGKHLTQADRQTAEVLENLMNNSLVRAADIEMGEFHAQSLLGREAAEGGRAGGKWNALKDAADEILYTKGAKRIALLRTFRKNLGREMREMYERSNPGLWDELKAQADLKAGGIMHDDDFAIQLLSENHLANNIIVNRLGKFGRLKADYRAAIQPGQWAAPLHLGELKPVSLDDTAWLMGLSGKSGDDLTSAAKIRAALASGDTTHEDITRLLKAYGADDDFVRRVNNALDFSWDGFWGAAGRAFSLTNAESRALQDMFAHAAELRGMTPVDYMSQVFSPYILDGTEGTIGDLGKAVDLLRTKASPEELGLAQLAGVAGESTREDLIRQLSEVFSSHLDPSAKKHLLMRFRPELDKAVRDGTLKLDLTELKAMWDSDAENQLAQVITQYMNDQIEVTPFPQTIDEYDKLYPDETVFVTDPALPGITLVSNRSIGDMFRADVPPELQAPIVATLGEMRARFPGIPLKGVELIDFSTIGVGRTTAGLTLGYEGGETVLFLSNRHYGSAYEQVWNDITARNIRSMADTTFPLRIGNKVVDYPRRTPLGVPYSAATSPVNTVLHEYGHAIDSFIRESAEAIEPAWIQKYGDYINFADDFDMSPAAYTLSEYATDNEFEAMGELLAMYLDPATDWTVYPTTVPAALAKGRGPKTVIEARDQLAAALKRSGIEVEPQNIKLPPGVTNPDEIRAAQMFGKWAQGAIADGLLAGNKAVHGGLLQEVAGLPVNAAVPYNLTEGVLQKAVVDSMANKWEDAYRLQYFARGRSMAERSINHPMFGIYPASYMWGKIAPEMFHFIAQEPFGVRTGALAYGLHDVNKAIAVQRELDPDFDQKIEEMGHSQALWFLGYLLPAQPWDVGAAMPGWSRDIADQGLAQETDIEAGREVADMDWRRPVQKLSDYISPFRSALQTERVLSEVTDEEKAPTEPKVYGGAPTGPVQAADLGPTLSEQMQVLQEVLGR